MELTIDQALQKGVEAHKSGQLQEADLYYTAILKKQPTHPDANHNMGVLAVGVGKFETALPFLKTALEANPKIEQFWLSYIDALIKLDRLTDAKTVFDQAKSIGAKGDGFDKLEQRLNETIEQPRTTTSSVDKASKVQNPPEDLQQPIINLYKKGELQQALKQIKTLVQQFPKSYVLFNIQGAILKGLGQLELSFEAYRKALAIKPDYAEAHYNIGVTLQQQDKLDEAVMAYKKAIAVKHDYAEPHYNIGVTLQQQGKLDEAIVAYKKAIAVKHDYAEPHFNIGVTLQQQGKLDEAIVAYKEATAIRHDYAEAYNNIGAALTAQGHLEQAKEACDTALAIKPDYAEAYRNMGNCLRAEGKLKEALVFFKAAGRHSHKLRSNVWPSIIDCQDNSLTKKIRGLHKVENEKIKRSTEWFIRKEKQYGGRVKGVRRTNVSSHERSDSFQLLNGHEGGDRMDFARGCHWYAPIYSAAINSYLMESSIDPMHADLLISEIGILNGSGLAIWSDSFPASKIIGFDLDLQIYENNKAFLLSKGAFQSSVPETFQIDQYEVNEVEVKQKINGQKINICIDDGAHTDASIINTFSAFKKNLCDEFLYFVEDNLNTKSFLSPLHSDIEIKQFGEMAVIFPSSLRILNKVDTIDDILKSTGISPDEIWGSS